MRVGRGTRGVVSGVAVVAAYALVVRPRMLGWGATGQERAGVFPGEGVIAGGARTATMATTLDAPPAVVWAWLAQMGTDRGGWYSWDRLDNFGRRSATEINPHWQQLQQGDRLATTPDGSQWWQAAVVEPERFLGLRMSLDLRGRPCDPTGDVRPRFYTDSLWGFMLRELLGYETHLAQACTERGVLEPSHWVMQTRQFTNLRRRCRAEGLGAGEVL